MVAAMHSILVAAEPSRWETLSRGLSSGLRGREIELGDLLIALGMLLGMGILVWLLARFWPLSRPRRPHHGRRRLFFSLCRAHRLRWREYWWLWRLAQFQQLRDPARLFLEPQRFDPVNLSPGLRLRQAELNELRERLFALSPRKPDVPQISAAREGRPTEEPRGSGPLLPTIAPPTLDLPAWNAEPPTVGPPTP